MLMVGSAWNRYCDPMAHYHAAAKKAPHRSPRDLIISEKASNVLPIGATADTTGTGFSSRMG
jgi:hypothetical protein